MLPVAELIVVVAIICSGWAVNRVVAVYRYYTYNDATGVEVQGFEQPWKIDVTGYKPGFEPKNQQTLYRPDVNE